jgi:parallel beta-helix repeat protein
MRYTTIIFCALLVLFSVHQAQATIIHVPGDYPTIQQAIDATTDGDTVLVQPGTYVENINFNGHNIIVGSLFLTTGDTSYIDSTIIDGDSSGWVVTFHNGEDSTAVITGFTIQNGYTPHDGGGIWCSLSSPTIRNNTISGNGAHWGGGIACVSSDPTISNNTISENSAASYGGGISCYNSSPTISNNTITGNSAYYTGGGIFCRMHSDPTITDNTISGNSATYYGGGIFCLFDSSPTISNNTISGNSAAGGSGGGICYDNDSSPTISNTIIAFSSQGEAICCFGSSSPVLTCCDVYGNEGGDWVGCIAGQDTIAGNISCDPLFCYPDTGNYYLNDSSCCVGAGCDSLGNPDSTVDIGVFGVGCSYVRGDANGDGVIDVADVVYLINYLFISGPAPDPFWLGDANCDGVVNIADAVYLRNYLFLSGPPPSC